MNASTQQIINVGALTLDEVSTPGAVANHAVIYAEDNGSGKTRLMCRFGSGSPVQICIEP